MKKMLALLMVGLWVMIGTAACSTEEDDAPCLGDSLCGGGTVWDTDPEDLRPAEALVTDFLSAPITGTVESESTDSACSYSGEPFNLTFHSLSPMDCGEDDCTNAKSGKISFNATLQIGDATFEFVDNALLIYDVENLDISFTVNSNVSTIEGTSEIELRESHDEQPYTPSSQLGPFLFTLRNPTSQELISGCWFTPN